MTLENWSRDPHEVSVKFLQQLNSKDSKVMAASVHELRTAPPKVLMRLLEEEAALQTQAEVQALPYALGSLACVMMVVIVSVFHLSAWLRVEGSAFLILVFYVVLIMATKALAGRASQKSRTCSEWAREQICAAIRTNKDPALLSLILERLQLGHSGNRYLTQEEPYASFCMALEDLFALAEPGGAAGRLTTLRKHVAVFTTGDTDFRCLEDYRSCVTGRVGNVGVYERGEKLALR